MTPGEVVNLVGIIIVLLTTIIGWVITYRTQQRLITLQNKFEAGQEKIKHVAPSRLTELEHMKEWVQEGYDLFEEAGYISIYLNKSKSSGVREKFDPDTLIKRGVNWASSIGRYGQLATIYDTKYPASSKFDPSKPDWPLSNFLDAYRTTIVEVLNEEITAYIKSEGPLPSSASVKIAVDAGDPNIDVPKYPGTPYQLYSAILAAIERVKELVVSQPA